MVPPSHSRISRYHGWLARRPITVLVAAAFIGLLATGLASRLGLKTAFTELLPSHDPGVVALARTQKRLGDLSLLLIGIRSPDHEANLRYAEALTQKLRQLPPSVVDLATYHVRDVRSFFQENKWLYVSEDDLESIRDRLRSEISKRKNPLYVSLGEDEPIDAMQKRMSGKHSLDDRFPGGVFTSKGPGGEYVWIAALPPGGLFVENAGEALLNAANDLISEDPPTRYHRDMKVEPAGPIVTGIASRHAIERDIVSVTLFCLIVVAASIGLYFRRWRAIPLTGIPAVMGSVMAFAVAERAFGYLNSSTAFLGSIIIGNGINYAIVLMSRYEEHRARGDGPDEALRCALAGTWRGTLVASIAASAAYASLMVTSFRGFYQFGVMGATGALFCWVATYSVLPAMLTWLDRPHPQAGWRAALWRVHPLIWPLALVPSVAAAAAVAWLASKKHSAVATWQVQHLRAAFPKLTALVVLLAAILIWAVPVVVVVVRRILRRDADGTYPMQASNAVLPRAPLEFGALARFLRRHGGAVTAAFTVMSVVSVVGLRHFLKDPFEYDFRKLNAKLATTQDEQQFNKNLNDLFGRWPSPTILLADSVDEVEPMKAAIRRQDREVPGPDAVGQIVTIFDLLPGPPEVQRRKLELLAQIRKLTHDPALSILDEKEKADLAKIDPAPDLHELTPMDVPPLARRPFTEVDGTVGKVVLVYPPEQNISVWNGRDLLRIASVLQTIKLDNGKVIETSGFAVVFGSMIRSILHDGPIATVASLIAVLIIIAFTIRPAAAALMALATLAIGVLWMMGGAGLAKVHVTFLNFIALPITFGIAAEYALNVVTRYREERDVSRAVVSTGAAVALCSWTTIVGYGSLLAASNQALNGFGMMAIIGEVVCLSAAIVALPAFLFWRHARPFQEEPRRSNGVGETAPALASDGEDPPSTTI
jgi:predicted RND superfamily exporter protein